MAAVGPASASREAEPAVAPDAASLEAGLAELRALFAGSCSLGTSAPGFGVSPPVRSGAANGLVHDSLWRAEAPRACKASLRALQERAGPRALDSCAGDYRLLMASPDQGLALLAGALEEDDEDGACPMGMSLGTSAGGAFMDEALPGRRLPPSAARSRASSRASPAPGGWCGAASVPAHSPSPDPDASLLFSY